MTTTTTYGSWVLYGDGGLTIEDNVRDALGADAADYDVEAIVADCRKAVNDALPEGWTLDGDQFHGPAGKSEHFAMKVCTAAVCTALNGDDCEGASRFWEIVARHEKTVSR